MNKPHSTAQKIISGQGNTRHKRSISEHACKRKLTWIGFVSGTIYFFPDESKLFQRMDDCFFNVSTPEQEQEHLHGNI